MNTTQAENLRILIRHMDGLKRKLDMRKWSYICGTPACAMGEACIAVPALASKPGEMDAKCHSEYCDGDVFGLGIFSARLFGPGDFNHWKRAVVTPQEWAAEARKVLAVNGYSMDEPKPAQTFENFMARVLKPLDVVTADDSARAIDAMIRDGIR